MNDIKLKEFGIISFLSFTVKMLSMSGKMISDILKKSTITTKRVI